MTFNPTLCAVDRVGQAPRFGDVDSAVSIDFQHTAQRSEPGRPKDAPRSSHPVLLSDFRSKRACLPEPPQLVRRHGIERRGELLSERALVVLGKALRAVERLGAWTEPKGPTLTYHVRPVAEPERDGLLEEARAIITSHGYQARAAHAALEARPPIGWDKGRAVLHILRARYGPAWSESVRVIYVGDDQTDEDAFRFLSGLATTFRVGSPDSATAATRRLPSVEAVRRLLGWLARRPAPRSR